MYKGHHLLIDCCDVGQSVCEDDALVLDTMARAAKGAGAHVISQVRYRFGHNSPPGFTAIVMLDESHVSAHCYADTRQLALDIFTCGQTNPYDILRELQASLDLGTVTVDRRSRFAPQNEEAPSQPAGEVSVPA